MKIEIETINECFVEKNRILKREPFLDSIYCLSDLF